MQEKTGNVVEGKRGASESVDSARKNVKSITFKGIIIGASMTI